MNQRKTRLTGYDKNGPLGYSTNNKQQIMTEKPKIMISKGQIDELKQELRREMSEKSKVDKPSAT